MKRKIVVVTGSRAEYGLLYWIIKGIQEDQCVELQLIVTGMHLSPVFGMTVKEIENDEFPIAARVDMELISDTEESIARSMGIGIVKFSDVYSRLHPDIIVVLGDRFEIFSAVSAALPFRIPVAHIHGGESTEGAMDEVIRHAITKMSHIHFVSTERYRQRIIQMGENSEHVFCFGAPGLDSMKKIKLLAKDELMKNLDITDSLPIGLVTYHPVTLEKNAASQQMDELLRALGEIEDMFWIFTLPNADMEGLTIMKKIKEFVWCYPKNSKVFASLGRLRYLSLLAYVAVMVGNSSSGIIEAASFKLPVVNIGDRQKGRIHAENVIDILQCTTSEIRAGIHEACSEKFVRSLENLENPYGNGQTSEQIVHTLKHISLGEDLIKKHFHEIEWTGTVS